MTELQSKRIYLAGRLDTGEGAIGDFADELETNGHTVLEKWWLEGRLAKPYLDNPQTSGPAAEAMIRAAWASDVMILFPTDDILGAAVEFGAALGSGEANLHKQILVVNPWEVRQSVFYAHPAVTAVRGLGEVRSMDWFRAN